MTAVPSNPAPAPAPPLDAERGRALAFVGYGLLLISLFTAGLSGFIAMILAYDRKGQSGPVARSHFAFQLTIFWICFALTAAAGALWIGGLISLLTSPPPDAPLHGSPDAQLVSLAASRLWPADVESWSYRFSAGPARLPAAAHWQLAAGSASMAASALFSWIGPVFGIVRLASGRPIGHRRSRTAEPTP